MMQMSNDACTAGEVGCNTSNNITFRLLLLRANQRNGNINLVIQLLAGKFMNRILLLVAAFCFDPLISNYSKAFAQEASFWNIKTEHFSCLRENLSKYESVKTDKVVIFLEECPEIDLIKIIKGRTKNSVLPDINKIEQTGTKFAEVISFDHKQLSCLKELNISSIDGLVKIPRNPCK